MMGKQLTILFFLLINTFVLLAKEYTIKSPDGKLETIISIDKEIKYRVNFRGKSVLTNSEISLKLDNGLILGKNASLRKAQKQSVSEIIKPVVKQKSKEVFNNYNQLILKFRNNYSLEFRVFDDGVAFRWETHIKEEIIVNSEDVNYNFTENHKVWFPEEESVYSHQERTYKFVSLEEITSERFCSTPALVDGGKSLKVLISEADLDDYPGMFLKGSKDSNSLKGMFAGFPLETKQTSDRDVKVLKHANYLAKTKGTRTFPWRLMVITDEDAGLVESQMVYKLAKPNRIADTTWIKPGKVAWDWWNANNIYGVDFEAGVNTQTYKYYIDFSAKFGLDYIILDEGWYHLDDVLKIKEEVDVKEIIRYGKTKNVGVILWVTWKGLDDKLDEALKTYSEWGAKGIKVDFMQRDDQWMVNYYRRVAEKAAEYKLLVDFHGSYKPTGLRRTFPNVITREGVKGLENSKWADTANPEQNTLLPFIRMVAGPLDYTPGAMENATKENFRAIFTEPMSSGTRCHQLGLYVIFESPLQMLADSPSNYMKEPECMEFISAVPSVWDETRVLQAKVGDYIAIARRLGKTWYVGAITNWDAREMELNLDFLDPGYSKMKVWKDGKNADKYAADYTVEELDVPKDSIIKIKLSPGGGWVAIIGK